MKSECLIELLVEKGLVKERYSNDKFGEKFKKRVFVCKYAEVADKIIPTLNEEDKVIYKVNYGNEIITFDKEAINEYINKITDGKVTTSLLLGKYYGGIAFQFNNIILPYLNNFPEKYEIKSKETLNDIRFEIKNIEEAQKRRKRALQEKQEALDFLNSLPWKSV